MSYHSNLERLILLHEGLRLRPYTDSVGKLTIGIGRNLDDKGISEEEAWLLCCNDINEVWNRLESTLPFFINLSVVRKAVLIDMAFNLGVAGLMKFKQTLRAFAEGRFEDASKLMLQSKWARQVGKRATQLSEMTLTDRWPGALHGGTELPERVPALS